MSAATLPAGPAPTTTASALTIVAATVRGCADATAQVQKAAPYQSLRSPKHEGAVLRPETETVAQRRADVRGAGDVRDEIHLTGRIGIIQVDGWRQKPAHHRQRGCRD